MSTGSDLDQFPEPEIGSPEAGVPEAGPAPQRGPKGRTHQSLEDAAGELARAMGLPGPRGQNQREALILAARRALNAPDLNGINLNAAEWDSHKEELDELLAAGVALSAVRNEFGHVLTPASWTQQVSEVKETLTEASGRRTRLLSSKYRQARSTLSQVCIAKPPSELADQLSLLDAITHSQDQVRIIDRHLSLGVALFSQSRITGPQAWPELKALALWRRDVGEEIDSRAVPTGLLDYLSLNQPLGNLASLLETTEAASLAHERHSESVGAKLDAARRDLLDLGMRNPLLNYRLLRSRGTWVQSHSPQELIENLDNEERVALLVPEDGDGPAGRDPKLTSIHPAEELGKRLLSTYRLANSFIQEQGVNTLFLALGMLQWTDNSANKETRLAPLVLLPVSLERVPAQRGQFQLRHTGDDLQSNVSLREKLRLEFGISLPELPEENGLDIESYFDQVAEAVQSLDGWTVDRGRVALGFFSFSKFLMYRDLDLETWPEDESPTDHEIIGALLEDGFDEDLPDVGSDDNLDSVLAPGESYHVVDADGSQTLTLLDVKQGMNLVVQGPPGTGKSQTITNMIAEAVGRGKTVLFVSEKMAALEVVKRRLDNVGLGDACLELHSHKSAKKTVLDELSRTLELGRPRTGTVAEDITELARLRDRLNSYCDAVNRAIGDSGVTPFQTSGELLARAGDASPRVSISDLSSWSQAEYRRKRGLVEELQARLLYMGPPRKHPFLGSGLTDLLPAAEDELRTNLTSYCSALETLIEQANILAQNMRLTPPADLSDIKQSTAAARRAAAAPDMQGVDLMLDHWSERLEDIRNLVEHGAAMASLREEFGSSLRSHAWDQDLSAERLVLETEGVKPWRLLISDYRRTRARFAGLTPSGVPGAKRLLVLINAIATYQRHNSIYQEHTWLGPELFGGNWRGEDSDWTRIAQVGNWLVALNQEIADGLMPRALLAYLSRDPDPDLLAELVEAIDQSLVEFTIAAERAARALDLDVGRRFGHTGELAGQSLSEQVQLATGCLNRMENVHDMVRLNIQSADCLEEGLQGVLEAAYRWTEGEDALPNAYDRAWFESLWERALKERSELRSFDGAAHDQVRQSFQELDMRVLAHNRTRLAQAHWERLPKSQGGGQLAVLRRQFEMRRRHLPIRQLLERAGNPIKAIKPVFMMSPLSIAAYLSPGGIQFDLVVFDEASQVKPVDALGAVMRGKQVVVVGDSQQLPPTPFFETAGQVEEYSEEETTSDIESILGLFAAQNAPSRMLRWHYRSRHDSLIAVSNQEFYGGGLVLFPSPDASRESTGLFYHHLPDTVYGRGTTSTNPLEAEAVAQAVMNHARNRPELSLGVAAFSMAQTREVQDRLEELRAEDPSGERFFSAHPNEPFFVKNLETIQGDERDVVMVSIGYGRAADGRVDLNFGPLNREGGERRLNVLITRARRRCEVFTNMTEDDIDLERTQAQGVRALRKFLAFAHRGVLEIEPEEFAASEYAEPVTKFQQSVAEAVKENGYLVTEAPGWGTGTVDLAVSSPEQPDSYILGIECDGPSYDSARSARDRDRLRPQVLEGLGWRLHRAWCPEWASNPQRELERVLAAIEPAHPEQSASPELQPAEPELLAQPELEQEGPPIELEAEVHEPAPVESENSPEPQSEEPPVEVVAEVPEPVVVEPEVDIETAPDTGIIRDMVPEPIEAASDSKYRIAKPNITAKDKDLAAASPISLALWVAEVVQVESPVHISEAARRIFAVAGVRRPAKGVLSAMEETFDQLVESGQADRRGDFLWSTDMTQAPVRDRSGLPPSIRKLEMVSDEELAEAVCVVVGESYGIARAQATAPAARLLGFNRTTEAIWNRFDNVVTGLLIEGRIEEANGHLVLADSPVG